MLFVCIVLKIFGVEWFNLDTSIPLLNKIDEIVMNSVPLSFLYSFIFRTINTYLIYALCSKSLKVNTVKLTSLVIASIFFHYYVHNEILCFLLDFNMTLVLCYKQCSVKEYYSVMVLNLVYQYISLFIKNIGLHIMYYGLTTSVLFMIDYYIMLIITYLYLKKGDSSVCLIFHHFCSFLRTKLWKKPTKNSDPCSDKG